MFTIPGIDYQEIILTFNGVVLAKFGRKDAAKAFALQLATLYIYGKYYSFDKEV